MSQAYDDQDKPGYRERNTENKQGIVEITDHEQADACEEFEDRVAAIINRIGKPHKVESEPQPPLAAYHPSFAKVEELCTQLVDDAAKLLQSSKYQDEETSRLIELAKDSQTIKYPQARKIGLMGASAVGKSTLINAILDSPGLAFEGASGRAATCVITEYQHAWPTQKEPFMAEINLYGRDKIRTIIQDEFRAYHDFNSINKDQIDDETRDELTRSLETAVEIFKALFANKEEFRTDEAIDDFLGPATSGEKKSILEMLYRWIDGTIMQYGAEDGVLYLKADTAGELTSKLEPFVKTPTQSIINDDCHMTSLWPLVEIVRVGMHRPLLKRGLVIADLPGLSDVNKTRTQSSNQYIRGCEAVLLVAPILRIETDNVVHRRLNDLSRVFGSQRILVATKTDETRSLRLSDVEATPEAAKEYERIQSADKFKGEEISRLDKTRRRVGGKEKEELTQKISNIHLERKAYRVLLNDALVVMRNEKTKRNMRRKYQKMTSDGQTLPVFAVSSVDYQSQIYGYYEDDNWPLSVNVTGIPGLRYHCYQFPAKSRLEALKHYREGIVSELINSMFVWSSQYKVQRRSELRKVVAKPLREVEAEIVRYSKEIKLAMDNLIVQKSSWSPVDFNPEESFNLWTGKSQVSWIQHSKDAFKVWASWHPQTFAAFCRHNGSWQTSKQPFTNWNAEMLKPVVEDMTKAIKEFDEELIGYKETCLSNVTKLLDNIRKDLNGIEGVAAEPMEPFLASLAPKKVNLKKRLEDFAAQIEGASRTAKLHVDMIDNKDEDCFLMQAMSPLYAKCAQQAQKAKEKRIRNLDTALKTLVEDTIAKGEQFNKIGSGIQTVIEKELDKLQPKLLEDLCKVFRSVLDDFDRMFVVEETPNKQRDVLRHQVQVFVEKAKSKLNGPIDNEFAKATKGSD